VAGEGSHVNTQKFLDYGVKSSIVESELGTCNVRHRDVVYARGFEDPLALTLAHLASHLVDAPKLGIRLRPHKWGQLLSQLRVSEPEYVKHKGERRQIDSAHVMDVLVLQVIPQFLDRVLLSFHEQIRGQAIIDPMDSDIKAFYIAIREKYPQIVGSLRKELLPLREEWVSAVRRNSEDQSRSRDDINSSPKKKLRRSSSKTKRLLQVSFTFQRLLTQKGSIVRI
jgi:hypothetical protein